MTWQRLDCLAVKDWPLDGLQGGLPVGLTADPEAHDAWFRDKVKEALADTRPTVSHKQVMDEAQTLIDKKRGRIDSTQLLRPL